VQLWSLMRRGIATAELAAALAICIALPTSVDARATKRKVRAAPARLPCGDLIGFQVRLDRQGFSSGQIDGKAGANFSRTLSAYQTAHQLPTGKPDCATWESLGTASSEPAITSYTVTDADLKGPFEKVPPKLADQAKLTVLGYQTPMEAIAERFHASPALISQLNRGVAIAPGREIKVPAVAPFDAETKPPADGAAGDITIQVSKEESSLRATRSDGTLVFYAPVSSGSIHDPLPPGEYKVLGEAWRPVFHYNPDLFWDAKPADEKAKIPGGPNNPVGVVWISLSLEHYGLHGTPEPGNIGRTESHGCVRLTNWDAARVASLVKPGTPVVFK
jgi:lipoprotein-anchoring transpeptidase ErfK/SrfK